MSDLSFENVLIQVRDLLQRNKIKLWEPPYYLAVNSNEEEILKLADEFSDTLNIKFEYCLAAINELQSHAIDKLNSNEEMRNDGIATLKLRVPCKRGGTKLLNLKIKLAAPAAELLKLVENEIHVSSTRVKLISSGKVLDPQKTLLEQNVKNFQQLMALEMKESEVAVENEAYDRIAKIRKDAETLLNNKGQDYFKLENQNGEAIYLPEQERISIMMSLLLHEKGRAQMKIKNYSDALILFLEADSEIQNCNSPIISSIDNIALLNLDIVWCYLQLKSIMQLPDAERRIQICESSFKRTYGENFERVKKIKSSDVPERCLFLRLKILKAVLFFHQNRRQEALVHLTAAENELLELNVNDEYVQILIDMGYTKNEAINGLRSTYNTSLDGAVNFIIERRAKLKEARKIGKSERNIGRKLQNLGFDVNPKLVSSLIEMGFSSEISALALQKSKGCIQAALNLLHNEQETLNKELLNFIQADPDSIQKLVNLGFNADLVKNVLKLTSNNFDAALDALLKMQSDGNFELPVEQRSKTSESSSSSEASTSTAGPSESKVSNSLSPDEELAIFDNLRDDLTHLEDDDEYLTSTLEEEKDLINQYKRALQN